MSASERLKALGEEAEKLGLTNSLTDALPELIALVAACDTARLRGFSDREAQDILDALAALDVKLTNE